MPDYQAMYAVLFRKITAVIEQMQEAQRETEDMYISAEPPDIRIIEFGKEQDNGDQVDVETME